jgi:hypothetical protein
MDLSPLPAARSSGWIEDAKPRLIERYMYSLWKAICSRTLPGPPNWSWNLDLEPLDGDPGEQMIRSDHIWNKHVPARLEPIA